MVVRCTALLRGVHYAHMLCTTCALRCTGRTELCCAGALRTALLSLTCPPALGPAA